MSRPNFSEDVRMEVLEDCNWLCIECKKRRVEDFHHKKKNSKANQRKYPLFLQSKKNAAPFCRICHTSGTVKNKYKISDNEAQAFEDEMRGENEVKKIQAKY